MDDAICEGSRGAERSLEVVVDAGGVAVVSALEGEGNAGESYSMDVVLSGDDADA